MKKFLKYIWKLLTSDDSGKVSTQVIDVPVQDFPIDIPPKTEGHFEFALNYTFENEGVLSNDKYDRGGITKYGIILDDLKRIGMKNASASDIRDLTKDKAKEIYRKLYWDSLKLDFVENRGVATCLFDIGVVRGIGVPPKYCTEICGGFSKINEMNPNEFIKKFSARSLRGFQQIIMSNSSQKVFIKGWTNRANRLLTLMEK